MLKDSNLLWIKHLWNDFCSSPVSTTASSGVSSFSILLLMFHSVLSSSVSWCLTIPFIPTTDFPAVAELSHNVCQDPCQIISCFYWAVVRHVPGLGCNRLRTLLECFNFFYLTFLQHRDVYKKYWKMQYIGKCFNKTSAHWSRTYIFHAKAQVKYMVVMGNLFFFRKLLLLDSLFQWTSSDNQITSLFT